VGALALEAQDVIVMRTMKIARRFDGISPNFPLSKSVKV
jgi:hypothetical protein